MQLRSFVISSKMNNKGVTLVEVMIALVVLLIVFLGLIQTSLLSIDHNLRNEVRDEAVRLASDQMIAAKSLPFDSIVSLPATTFTRNFRNLSQNFSVTRTVNNIDTSNAQVTITVTYNYRGEWFTHSIVSAVRRT